MSATKSSSSPQRAVAARSRLTCSSAASTQSGYTVRASGCTNTCLARFGIGPSNIPSGRTSAPHSSFHASTSLAGPATNVGVLNRSRSAVTVGATARASGRGAGHSSEACSTTASVYSCRRRSSSRRRASASAATTLGRGPRVASLFETNEVVDTDPSERRHFLAAQPRRSPAAAVGQPDVARPQLLAASVEELGHRCHDTSMP